MTDDLKARLRSFDPHTHELEVVDEAADRIEALESALTQSKAEIAAAYERAADVCFDPKYKAVTTSDWVSARTAGYIRALATTDQTSALDTIRAEARAQGMQPLIDAASAVVDAMNAPDKPWDLPSRVLRELIDAIKGAKA